jgi:hypothetical protein
MRRSLASCGPRRERAFERTRSLLMPKHFFRVLTTLALLFAALVLGKETAARTNEGHSVTTVRSTVRGLATVRPSARCHAVIHVPSHAGTTIDDDDESDDDDELDTAMLAPDGHERHAAPDATPSERDATADSSLFATRIAALPVTGRGIAPSGEHRLGADRPPRI